MAHYGSTWNNCSTPLGYDAWVCSGDNTCQDKLNPDVYGLGVLSAFFITASFTFLLAWAIFLLDANFNPDLLGILDRQFLHAFNTILCRKSLLQMSQRWKSVCQSMILAFSDVHLVTGIAILSAGLSQANSITVFDFNVVVRLGWISSSVHLVTLTICREYFRRNSALLYWRVGAMVVLYMILITSLFLSASNQNPMASLPLDGSQFLPSDAQVSCLWKSFGSTPLRADAILAILVVTLGYISRLCKLLVTTTDFFRKWLRVKPGRYWRFVFEWYSHHRTAHQSTWLCCCMSILQWWHISIYLHMRALYDIYESLLTELIWLTLSLVWGLSVIVSLRNSAPFSAIQIVWNFGQWMPMLMLLSPFIAAPEYYHRAVKDEEASATESSNRSPSSYQLIRHADRSLSEPTSLRVIDSLGPATQRDTEQVPEQSTTYRRQQTSFHPCIQDSREHCNSSQLRRSSLPELFLYPTAAYNSRAYRFLVSLYLLDLVAMFLLLITFNMIGIGGDGEASTLNVVELIAMDDFYFIVIALPILVGPFGFWICFVAPFSRSIQRNLKEASRRT